jgi:hypothetical protein
VTSSCLDPDRRKWQIEVVVNDNHVFWICFKVIDKLSNSDAAQVHIDLRFCKKNGDAIYPALSKAAIKALLIQRNPVIGSQLIQDQKSHIVPAELIPTAWIAQPDDQLQ